MSGVYSMVNSPCLARDLSRHPYAADVATDLLRIAALGPEQFASLDRLRVAADARARREAVDARMQVEPRALRVLAATRDVAGDGVDDAAGAGLAVWSAAVDVLEAAPIGGLPELVDLVRDEIAAGAWQRADGLAVATWPTALDVVADAVRAVYVPTDVRPLAAPLGRPWRRWLAASGHRPAAADPPVADLLAALEDATPKQLAAAAQALRRQRAAGWSWAAAVHDACWAVHLTGRERPALVAQLHAVRLLRQAAVATYPSLDAVSAAVAAVHARAVADVLAADVVAAMTAPLDAALG